MVGGDTVVILIAAFRLLRSVLPFLLGSSVIYLLLKRAAERRVRESDEK